MIATYQRSLSNTAFANVLPGLAVISEKTLLEGFDPQL